MKVNELKEKFEIDKWEINCVLESFILFKKMFGQEEFIVSVIIDGDDVLGVDDITLTLDDNYISAQDAIYFTRRFEKIQEQLVALEIPFFSAKEIKKRKR